MKYIKLFSLFIIPVITLLLGVTAIYNATPVSAVADVNDICSNPEVAKQVKAASGCPDVTMSTELDDAIQGILNGVIAVAGTVAVAFIVVGGFNYMTSAGDANKVTKARNTIMYACIGLVICALSFIIVNFVIVDLIAGGQTAPAGADEVGVETVGADSRHDLPEMVRAVANGVIAVLGTACVIVMIVGGFNYMSSGGDSGKVAKAKNIILYGLIGLVICVLSFAIVNFVIVSIIHGQDPEGVPVPTEPE